MMKSIALRVYLLLPLLVCATPVPVPIPTFIPAPGNFPSKGDGDYAGGVFSFPLSELPKYMNPTGSGTETPKGNGIKTSGSGPYPAGSVTDSTLPGHTIYAPKTPPAGNVSLPFIAWANGGCTPTPADYDNFLTEVASHGYVIAADGLLTGSGFPSVGSQSKVQDMRDSVDWAFAGKASKYGNVDTTKGVTTAGHSCGGQEALSTAYHDDARIKRVMMFDIAIFQDDRRYLLGEIKVPVVWVVGGKNDMGTAPSAKDYAAFPATLPKLRISLDTGHSGTFSATNGGKFGKAAVAYLDWQWKGNDTAKAMILNKDTPGSLVRDNWTVESVGWL